MENNIKKYFNVNKYEPKTNIHESGRVDKQTRPLTDELRYNVHCSKSRLLVFRSSSLQWVSWSTIF